MALTGYAEDLEAINRYFHSYTPSKIPENANLLLNDWVNWYSKLTWWSMNTNKELWIEGRAKRKAFNAALGTPESIDGMTSEIMYPSGVPGSGLAQVAVAMPDIGKALIPIITPIIYVVGGGIIANMLLQSLVRSNRKDFY
jgi:hypothetical protein